MKTSHKNCFVLLLLISAMLMTADISNAGYTITQLTNNNSSDEYPQINASGWVTWTGRVGDDREIFLYNGSTIINISNNANYYDYWASPINDSGWVTWTGLGDDGEEIFLYNGTSVTNISNNTNFYDLAPQINNSGWVTWSGDNGDDVEIFLYNGNTVINISNNPSVDDWHPQINGSGWVTWNSDIPWYVYLYNGTTVTRISNSASDMHPQINDNGWITWQGIFFIYLYNGSSVTNISDSSGSFRPQINANGWITWYKADGNDWEIFLYNGTTITQLTNNSYEDRSPQINDSGWVTWEGSDGNDWEIFLYNGTTITQLTNNGYDDSRPQINGSGWVTWEGSDGNDREIFLAKPSDVATQTWYKDADGDKYSDATSLQSADRPLGYYLASELIATTGDFNDNDDTVHPGAAEICGDGKDNNCDGRIDEGCSGDNNSPTANAGPDQTVTEGSVVTLDGSGSMDSDGTIATYSWTQTAGQTVSLSQNNVARPTFTAPSVSESTTLTFQLTVEDNGGLTSTDSVNITVNKLSDKDDGSNGGGGGGCFVSTINE